MDYHGGKSWNEKDFASNSVQYFITAANETKRDNTWANISLSAPGQDIKTFTVVRNYLGQMPFTQDQTATLQGYRVTINHYTVGDCEGRTIIIIHDA